MGSKKHLRVLFCWLSNSMDSFEKHLESILNLNQYIDSTKYKIVNGSIYAEDFNFDSIASGNDVIRLNNRFTSKTYFPYWLAMSIGWAKQDLVDVNARYRFSIVCLNDKIRYPRLYILDQLFKKSYSKEINFVGTFNNINNIYNKENIDNKNDLIFNGWQQAADNVLKNYNKFDTDSYTYRSRYRMPDTTTEIQRVSSICYGMDTAYLQVVNESRPELPAFVSEKIFKPLRGGQLFLVHGSTGTVEYLRQLGFDTFDDYIDHNRYDTEPSWQRRADIMLSVLDDIRPNIKQIYQATTERRQHNIDLFKKPELMDHVLAGIRRQL